MGESGPGAPGKPLTPTLCLGMSTELCLQQDNQDPGPAEALGEHALPDLLGAGVGRLPAHPPDRAAGHLSPTEQWGQQCRTGPGHRCRLGAWGLTQLGLEERPSGHTGWSWSPENPSVCSHLSHPTERRRATLTCAPLYLLSPHRQASPIWSSVKAAVWLKPSVCVHKVLQVGSSFSASTPGVV